MAIYLGPRLLSDSSPFLIFRNIDISSWVAPDRSFSLRRITPSECELLPHLFSPLPPPCEKRILVFPMTIGGIVSVTPPTHYWKTIMKSELRLSSEYPAPTLHRRAAVSRYRLYALRALISELRICFEYANSYIRIDSFFVDRVRSTTGVRTFLPQQNV